MIALLQMAVVERRLFCVPAGVLGQVRRNGRLQVTLARFLRSAEVEIVPLDEAMARACGELCGATRTPNVIDASVVLLARERKEAIVASDPKALKRLDPEALIVPI